MSCFICFEMIDDGYVATSCCGMEACIPCYMQKYVDAPIRCLECRVEIGRLWQWEVQTNKEPTEEERICGVCLEVPRDPIILQCNHVLCRVCLTNLRLNPCVECAHPNCDGIWPGIPIRQQSPPSQESSPQEEQTSEVETPSPSLISDESLDLRMPTLHL